MSTAILALVLGISNCPVPSDTGANAASRGNPRARAAAQRGLDFLAREAQVWQNQNKCFGCHVQAVTLEAMSVGRRHQYNVAQKDLDALVHGMLYLSGGARRPAGFGHETAAIGVPGARAFGGAAFARYDELVSNNLRDDLIKVAGELRRYQRDDGSVDMGSYVSPPVVTGDLEGTYLAAQTWREVYARTADDRWLLPLSRAEKFFAARARTWMQAPPADIQQLNYALMGLLAAGVSSTEASVRTLAKHLVMRQNRDGGFGLAAGTSDAFATGESLYALRRLGLTDADSTIARGTEWLIAHQEKDGGWSHAGRGKAEAMWAVLGLVTVDVLTVAVSGVEDGQHVDGTMKIGAQARDNQGRGVLKVELSLDDDPIAGECGSSFTYAWDTRKLSPGKHILDVTATNAKGQMSRRRMEVFAGPVYLTQIGSRSASDATVVSLRNIAPASLKNTVEVQILTADGKREVARLSQNGAPGAMEFKWDGQGKDGKSQASGKYVARIVLRDDGKKAVQTEDVPFVRDSEAAQLAKYGEIQGRLALDGAGNAANAPVELVDEKGRVVQVSRSTSEGQYRFRNVEGGKYKIRVRKEGWAPAEASVAAEPGAKAADAPAMSLHH